MTETSPEAKFSGDVSRFVTRFSRQSPTRVAGKSGTDARFPYEHQQIVVVGLVLFLLWEQGRYSLKEGRVILLSIQLSIDSDIIRHRKG